MSADHGSWPHTRAYRETLPDGLGSYPTTLVKASALLTFRARLELDGLHEMPADLADVVRYAPLPSQWLPTVHMNVVEMMLVAQLGSAGRSESLTRRTR